MGDETRVITKHLIAYRTTERPPMRDNETVGYGQTARTKTVGYTN
jgi:hypothetical protein